MRPLTISVPGFTHSPLDVAIVLLAAAIVGALFADRALRRVAGERRRRIEALHAEAFQLLLDDPAATGDRIAATLARIAVLIGADRIWTVIGDGREDYHGWGADGTPTREAAAGTVARITERFPWDGNAILVAPGDRASIAWRDCLARRRAVPLSALLLRSRDMNDVALLCATAAPRRLRVRPETVQGLAAALLIILQLDRRRRLEADRVALESKLALGRRMEAVGALASGFAHNLNNILTAIGGFRATAALHAGDGAAAEPLDEIGHAVDRAAALVADVLRFGRRVEGPPEPVDLVELLGQTRKLLSASLPGGIVLAGGDAAAGDDGPLRVAGEFGQLQQVLLNLCNNAAHAMPGGGTIELRAVPRLLDDPIRLSHGVLRRGRYATVVVADEGSGIAEAAIPHLFDAFYTTRSGGSGLGLSTAREIVEGHGGAIDVDSLIGVGSRFTVWLPLAAVGGEAGAVPRPARGAGEIVMLVNADPRRLSGDEELLAALGYEPLGIAAGQPMSDVAVDAVVVAGLDPAATDALAAAVRTAGIDAPMLIAVPQPREGAAMLRYPFRPAYLAHALARCLEDGAPRVTTVA